MHSAPTLNRIDMQDRVNIKAILDPGFYARLDHENTMHSDREIGLTLDGDSQLAARQGAVSQPGLFGIKLERMTRPDGLHPERKFWRDLHHLVGLKVGFGEGYVWWKTSISTLKGEGWETGGNRRRVEWKHPHSLLGWPMPVSRMRPGAISHSSISRRPSEEGRPADMSADDGNPVVVALVRKAPVETVCFSLGGRGNVASFLVCSDLASVSTCRSLNLSDLRRKALDSSIPSSDSSL